MTALVPGTSLFNQYSFGEDFSVSWNKPVPLTLLITASDSIPGDMDSIQYTWTNGFTLPPSNNYNISLAMVTYTLGSFSWVSYEPGMPITSHSPSSH